MRIGSRTKKFIRGLKFARFEFVKLKTSIVYTANIVDVIFTVLKCVRLSTVISLYGLHLIAAPSTVE